MANPSLHLQEFLTLLLKMEFLNLDQKLSVENPCPELEWYQQLLGYLQHQLGVRISPIFWLVLVNFLAMTMYLLLLHVRNMYHEVKVL